MRYLHHWRAWRFKKPSRQTILRSLAVAAVLLLVVFIIRAHSPRPGTVAFNKYSASLVDYNGKTVRFDTFTQRPLVVFFWATWCPYCKAELTHLGELRAQYGDRLQVIAVNRGESRSDAKTFSDALVLPKGVMFLLDPNDSLFKQLGGYAVPETIFVNSRGEEVVHHHGPLKPEEADKAVLQII